MTRAEHIVALLAPHVPPEVRVEVRGRGVYIEVPGEQLWNGTWMVDEAATDRDAFDMVRGGVEDMVAEWTTGPCALVVPWRPRDRHPGATRLAALPVVPNVEG